MSTRANIILQEGNEQMYFYRHSDGYPEGTMPLLKKFMDFVKSGSIRDDISQSAGWLIILGAIEYNSVPEFETREPFFVGARKYGEIESIKEPKDWKAGSIEPTTGIHGDIEYLYIINLQHKTIEIIEEDFDRYEP